jgi:hypothetical protein
MKRVPASNMRWNSGEFNSLQRMVEAQVYVYESAYIQSAHSEARSPRRLLCARPTDNRQTKIEAGTSQPRLATLDVIRRAFERPAWNSSIKMAEGAGVRLRQPSQPTAPKK